MPTLYIDYDARTEVEEDTLGDDGPYTGYRETSTSLTVHQLTRTAKETFFTDIEVSDEVYKAEKAYLVVVRYTTGSTFGHDSGCYKFIAVFASKADAEILAKEIKEKKERSSFIPSIKNPAYQELYCSWSGYCECIESVDIQGLVIED